ncbi:fluoride efflux transporter CrcB [Pseudonocardia sp. RS010]|uniref:fluoride efflux transporter CrcB n=1 Tax=Pseudonocardia sp. RS010 TaxID=3385979 RepID=UPI0039A06104
MPLPYPSSGDDGQHRRAERELPPGTEQDTEQGIEPGPVRKAEHDAEIDPDREPEPGPRRRQPRLVTVVGAVAAGGALGAEARYGLGSALPHVPAQWPWSTLLANVTGCVLIGILMVVITELVDAHPLVRPLLGVGFLGGYTTFSTYTVDTLALARTGHLPWAIGYVVATPVLAVLGAAAGAAVARVGATRLVARDGRSARPDGVPDGRDSAAGADHAAGRPTPRSPEQERR